MIKVKLEQIITGLPTLQKISEQPLNGLEAYKINKALNEFSKELDNYNQARQKLLQQYCELDEQGNIKVNSEGIGSIKPEYIPIYNQEITNLNNVEIELAIPQLDADNLAHFELSPREVQDIIWWIK